MGALQRISSIGHTCRDAVGSSQWYASALGFEPVDVEQFSGDWLSELLGLPSAALHRHRLRLGQETLELWQFDHANLDPIGQQQSSQAPCPAGNDSAFQHICIVTSDLAKAFAHGASARHLQQTAERLAHEKRSRPCAVGR
jgi:catechol 2,3-dioxygenase-like lactoylglutathione lyase family enzyme